MRILVDENIPLMTVERVIDAIKLFPAAQWPGLLVVMRDRAMSTWRQSKQE